MSNALEDQNRGWWTYLNKYHWYVFGLASLGWLFDTMDGQIFLASRSQAMNSLMSDLSTAQQSQYGGYVTTAFVIGWATGGLIFGIVGDRWGRAKTMALTIMIYAVFTGLSGIAQHWWDFAIYRFLTGLGVGGEFASGTALVAEAMPEKARTKALGMLQGLSAIGNMIGAALFGIIIPLVNNLGWSHGSGWRYLYMVGAFPALLAIYVRLGLKEPDKWLEAKHSTETHSASAELGKMSDLFTIPKWRRNTLVGLGLAIPGIIGVWGIGFYSPELIDSTFPKVTLSLRTDVEAVLEKDELTQEKYIVALDPEKNQKPMQNFVYKVLRPGVPIEKEIVVKNLVLTPENKVIVKNKLAMSLLPEQHDRLKMWGLIVQQIGAFFGMFGFALVSQRIGRRMTFLLSFAAAWGSIMLVFSSMRSYEQVFFMLPILGFGTLAPLGGFAVYFPELFPTRLRTTGIGFCYNVGRYVSAFGSIMLTTLALYLTKSYGEEGFRIAAMSVASVYFIGMLVLLWAPETAHKPLPEN